MNGNKTPAQIPALSVIMSMSDVPAHLPPRQLDAAIRAIRDQSFADFEFLILVDGASVDMAQIILGHALDDRRIRMITVEGVQGLAGLNHLHEVARAPFIARADATDISTPDRLERQMAVLADNPDHGVIGTGCLHRAIEAKTLVRRDPARPFAAVPVSADGEFIWPEAPQPPLGDARIRGGLEAGPPMDCATLIYARAAVLAAGGYRPALGKAAGYDLLLRLSSHARLAKLPEALVSRIPQPDAKQTAGAENDIIARAAQNAIAWLCHRERLAGRVDPVAALGRLPAESELDALFGRGAGDVVRRRVVEASLHAPGALANDGWDMLQTYARRHQDDPRMWRLAARMLAAGKPLRAGQLGMALMTA